MKNKTVYSISIILILLSIYNMIINPKDFFKISAASVLTIAIGLLLSFLFVQQKNDEVRKKQKVDQILTNAILHLEDLKTLDFSSDFKPNFTNLKRRVGNSIYALNQIQHCIKYNSDNESFKSDLDYIENSFKEYSEIIGNHYSDVEYLLSSKIDFERILGNMIDKMNLVSIRLYL